MKTTHLTMALALAGSALLNACGSPDATDTEATPAASDDVETPAPEASVTPEPEASEAPEPEATATPEPKTAETPPPAEPKPAAPVAAPKVAEAPAAFAQCRSCHAVEPGKNMVGPSLAGIYGTKAGAVAGYNFSPAMKESGLTWDAKTLDAFLKAPREVVPGTRMVIPGVKSDEARSAIIAYLKALK